MYQQYQVLWQAVIICFDQFETFVNELYFYA